MKRLLVALSITAISAAAGSSLQGCGTPGNTGADAGTSSSIPFDQACPQFLDATLDKVPSCMGVAREFVAEMLNVTTQCSNMTKAIAAGRQKYDGSKAQACIDAAKSQTCDQILGGGKPLACADMLSGAVAAGGTCYQSDDCSGDAYCETNGTCAGKCTAYVAVGGDCSNGQCTRGSSCISTKCVADVGPSQACGTSVAWCQIGANCSADPGTCQAAPTSGPCDFDRKQCAAGYACVGWTPSADGSCAPAKAVGASCTAGKKECLSGAACVGGTCKIAKVGDTCGYVGTMSSLEVVMCVGGYCDNDPQHGKMTGTCLAFKAVGATCAGGSECGFGGTCDSNSKCAAPCAVP